MNLRTHQRSEIILMGRHRSNSFKLLQVIEVPVPRLQTRESLLEKVLGDKHQAFVERQRRKAAAA